MFDRLTCFALVLILAACGKSEPVSDPPAGEPPAAEKEEAPTLRTVDPPAEAFAIAEGLLTDPILQLPTKDAVNVFVIVILKFSNSRHMPFHKNVKEKNRHGYFCPQNENAF